MLGDRLDCQGSVRMGRRRAGRPPAAGRFAERPWAARRARTACLLACLAALWLGRAGRARAEPFTIRLELGGQTVEGTPVAWSERRVVLLGRDGRLWDFAPGEASRYKRTAHGFRGYAPAELRGRLLREFGAGFDVSGGRRYLVVHPAGQRGRWVSWFDELHRSFTHYFTARGFRPAPPPFPLVAVVFPDQRTFLRHARRAGAPVSSAVAGYYSVRTNRILLYDAAAGSGGRGPGAANLATIIHEATHQAAFNSGLHSRYSPPPLWAAEGLATLFEAPGVWDGLRRRNPQERVNREQLDAFRRRVAARLSGSLLERLAASDRWFQTDPAAAYALSWALTFYLSQARPQDYLRYLKTTAAKRPLNEPSPAERLEDFHAALGRDPDMLAARLKRFLDEY